MPLTSIGIYSHVYIYIQIHTIHLIKNKNFKKETSYLARLQLLCLLGLTSLVMYGSSG